MVLYGITCKLWEDVVGHTLTFDWQRREFSRKLHPETIPCWRCWCSLAQGPQPVAAPRVPPACGLQLLQQNPGKLLAGSAVGHVTPPPFSALTIQEGYFNKIPVSQDSAYGAGLFWSGALSQCFPVSFLLTSSIFLGNISCSSQCRVYYQTLITAPFSLCGCPAQCPRVIWRGWEVFRQPCPEAVCSWSWKIKLKQWIKPNM